MKQVGVIKEKAGILITVEALHNLTTNVNVDDGKSKMLLKDKFLKTIMLLFFRDDST